MGMFEKPGETRPERAARLTRGRCAGDVIRITVAGHDVRVGCERVRTRHVEVHADLAGEATGLRDSRG